MASNPRGFRRRLRQFRPTVAGLFHRLSLRVRFGLLVALVVTAVVSATAYLEIRSVESRILGDLLETADATAQSAADDFEIRPDVDDTEDVADGLRAFKYAVPSVHDISIVRLTAGRPVVFASTSSGESSDALSTAKAAIATKAMVWGPDTEGLRTVAVPAYWADEVFGGLVLTFSTGSVDQVRKSGRTVVFWFVPPAIILLTLLVDMLTRRLIHRPIAAVRDTMRLAQAGNLKARALVVRHDEIGTVADGLNEMLAEMEHLNTALQSRVQEATAELRHRNRELVESYQRMFSLREALARAEQMAAVGQTAASVAHQIGTPLNLISGYVQMLMEELSAETRMTRRLEIVQEQITKVTGIVQTMLDHARRPSPRQATSIVQIINRVCEVARPKLTALGVQLEVDVDRTVPLVLADAVQLELALLNLVTNSLDAMPGGGVLKIAVAPGPSGVRVEVADTGAGISADLLPRIFDPWVTTKAVGHGSGLGLSITKDVIGGHGGSISAVSEPGAGATFCIDLPGVPVAADETVH
jgi:two-component system NtrC family sensor kinase